WRQPAPAPRLCTTPAARHHRKERPRPSPRRRTPSVQYDKLTVKARSTTLATYSNLNKASGYSQKSFNVSSFAGQTVTISYTGTEDSSLQTSFVIDDTALSVS